MPANRKTSGIFLVLIVLVVGIVVALNRGHPPVKPVEREATDEDKFAMELINLPNGKKRVQIKNKPENLVLLDWNPDEMEPELKLGRWLIFEGGINNVQDRAMEKMTIAAAQRFAGVCRVAIRQSDGFEDLPKWLPESEGLYEGYHPVWFALAEGKILGVTGFWLSEEDLAEFVNKSFSSTSSRP